MDSKDMDKSIVCGFLGHPVHLRAQRRQHARAVWSQ